MRQGNTLSPTLFVIYINDLVKNVKKLNIDTELDQEQIYILMYADDIVVFAKTEQELQCILDVTKEWGRKRRVKFNGSKSKVVHFRKPNTPQTQYNFKIGHLPISVVDRYKYMGVILNIYDTLDFNVIVNVLRDDGGCALGAIINKNKKLGGLGYYTYTTMYNARVCPILFLWECIILHQIWV